jgi:hypothetical protein
MESGAELLPSGSNRLLSPEPNDWCAELEAEPQEPRRDAILVEYAAEALTEPLRLLHRRVGQHPQHGYAPPVDGHEQKLDHEVRRDLRVQ